MANWNDRQTTRPGFGTTPNLRGDVTTGTTFDAGLRSHMLSIYNYMTSGILLTGIVSLLFARSGMAAQVMTGGPLTWLIVLSPLAIVMAMSFGANRFSKSTLAAMFWAYAVLIGLSISTIFLVYTASSIAVTFFATAGAFAGLSLFGYTTQKSLSGMGSFLIMGVVGLVIASLLNLWLQSPGLMYAISFLGVLIFAGLTAYDTQRIKTDYIAHAQHGDQEWLGKSAVMGALNLYMNFINIFMFLLQFLGNRD